jgi:hypothetical protein
MMLNVRQQMLPRMQAPERPATKSRVTSNGFLISSPTRRCASASKPFGQRRQIHHLQFHGLRRVNHLNGSIFDGYEGGAINLVPLKDFIQASLQRRQSEAP